MKWLGLKLANWKMPRFQPYSGDFDTDLQPAGRQGYLNQLADACDAEATSLPTIREYITKLVIVLMGWSRIPGAFSPNLGPTPERPYALARPSAIWGMLKMMAVAT